MQQPTNGKAVASLVFSILGLVGVCPLLGAILGILLGWGEPGDVARVGRILGWIGLALVLVWGVLALLGVIGMGFFWFFAELFD